MLHLCNSSCVEHHLCLQGSRSSFAMRRFRFLGKFLSWDKADPSNICFGGGGCMHMWDCGMCVKPDGCIRVSGEMATRVVRGSRAEFSERVSGEMTARVVSDLSRPGRRTTFCKRRDDSK
jgi:hypothetical protein